MRDFFAKANRARVIVACVCIVLLVFCGYYMIHWNLERNRILQNNESYGALYTAESPEASDAPASPSASATAPVPTTEPAAEPTATAEMPAPSDTPIIFETVQDERISVEQETVSDEPVPAEPEAAEDMLLTADAANEPASPAPEASPAETEAPRATPDADTIVLALETPPPVQDSFSALLAENPETVGFLTIGDWLSLPVVQRVNDNEFYLKHNFEGENSYAGTLFMDGSNLLVPEDEALIVYGHNMKNGTMLADLPLYENPSAFAENAFVRFDTIYENRTYIPFAVFSASAEPGTPGYFDFRQFLFDETTFDLFALRMKDLSLLSVPLDVRYGDRILLLVTCEYSHENGRLIVALRQKRDGETEDEIRAVMDRVKVK